MHSFAQQRFKFTVQGTVPISRGALWMFTEAHAQIGQDTTSFSPLNEINISWGFFPKKLRCMAHRLFVDIERREAREIKPHFFFLREMLAFLAVFSYMDVTLQAQRSINKHDHWSSVGCLPFMSEYVYIVMQPESLEWKKTMPRREECSESGSLDLDFGFPLLNQPGPIVHVDHTLPESVSG